MNEIFGKLRMWQSSRFALLQMDGEAVGQTDRHTGRQEPSDGVNNMLRPVQIF